jgi:hypothetical protein
LALIANSPQIGSTAAPEVMPLPFAAETAAQACGDHADTVERQPSIFAVSWRTGNGAWALAQTVRRPLGSICAAAMRGSKYCGWIILVS